MKAVLVVGPAGGARLAGRSLACTLGRGGVTLDKREGDGATPAGCHHIIGAFYRPDRLAAHAVPPWARPIGPADLWSDDPRDPAYNRHVRAPHPFSHEALRRADPQYDLLLVTDWNMDPAVPGRGSAIFVHIWHRPHAPTAGCIAFARNDLLWLAWRLPPGAKLIVRPPAPARPAAVAGGRPPPS